MRPTAGRVSRSGVYAGWPTINGSLGPMARSVTDLAKLLMEKSPVALRQAKNAYKHIGNLSWDTSEDYLAAKAEQTRAQDAGRGREKGLGQFLDDKSYRPGLESYRRES